MVLVVLSCCCVVLYCVFVELSRCCRGVVLLSRCVPWCVDGMWYCVFAFVVVLCY